MPSCSTAKEVLKWNNSLCSLVPGVLCVIFQVYTIEKLSKKLVVVGYATLNIFVETGSEKQPSTDSGGVQVTNYTNSCIRKFDIKKTVPVYTFAHRK